MWAYIVLSHLAREPADTQLALARAIHHDKTRLITLLDGLEGQGLITRTPDPADRRARIVKLTAAGAALHAAARADIRVMEEELLSGLERRERAELRDTLAGLVAASGAVLALPGGVPMGLSRGQAGIGWGRGSAGLAGSSP